MDRILSLELARVTELAAISAGRWMGKGQKIAADDAAVQAMRMMFDTIDIQGTVVIGEGEMDEAPMLYIGEKVGTGEGCAVDIAVDPLEGTNLVAKGQPNAIAVLAVAPTGCLLHAPDMYMDKICVGPAGKGRIDIDAPVKDNLRALAEGKGCEISDLTVVILDRPRHQELIEEVRAAGARCKLITDGDVAPAVAAALDDTGVDMVIGMGGAPEGVLAAAALKCVGGDLQARLVPHSAEDYRRCAEMGIPDTSVVLQLEDLVKGDDVIFSATGITDGDSLSGVRYFGGGADTSTLVMRSKTGTIRFIEATHFLDKKPFLKDILGD